VLELGSPSSSPGAVSPRYLSISTATD
jgi:hypothetical protein